MLDSELSEAIAKVIDIVGNTPGYNDKLYLLKKNEHVTGLKDVLRFIYNPYVKSGIGPEKLKQAINWMYQIHEDPYVTIQQIIEWFTRNQTGSDRDIAYAGQFLYSMQKYGERTFNLAKAILTQDLQIGITKTSLNTVYGKNFIPVVAPMLGIRYDDVPRVKWPCIVTEKLDGARRILIKSGGAISMYTRSGHPDEGLVDIEHEAGALPDNMVYDGELLAIGEFKDSIAHRQATNSIANSSGLRHGLTFNVFDMLPVDEFFDGKSTEKAFDRKVRLAATLGDIDGLEVLVKDEASRFYAAFCIGADFDYIKPVPVLGLVYNIDEVTPIVEPIWKRDYEGVMLNTTNGLYEIKRSKELIKIKHIEEVILPIIDFIEGEGKYEDSLGAIIVDYKGSRVGVGSGFTDDERQQIWSFQRSYLGRKVEIETFGESKNQTGSISLNCPIFKRFVGSD